METDYLHPFHNASQDVSQNLFTLKEVQSYIPIHRWYSEISALFALNVKSDFIALDTLCLSEVLAERTFWLLFWDILKKSLDIRITLLSLFCNSPN